MLGIVFTELVEFVEATFGDDVAADTIDAAELPSGGAYTAVGTYAFSELVALVQSLARITGETVPNLLTAYGRHLFGRFAALYPQFFEGVDSTLDFLEGVDRYIHVEVRKLYPDAELPRFHYTRTGSDQMELTYHSRRAIPDFARGLIEATADHFGENISIEAKELPPHDGSVVCFELKQQSD